MADKQEVGRSLSDESNDGEPKHSPLHPRRSWPNENEPVSPRGPMKGKYVITVWQRNKLRCVKA